MEEEGEEERRKRREKRSTRGRQCGRGHSPPKTGFRDLTSSDFFFSARLQARPWERAWVVRLPTAQANKEAGGFCKAKHRGSDGNGSTKTGATKANKEAGGDCKEKRRGSEGTNLTGGEKQENKKIMPFPLGRVKWHGYFPCGVFTTHTDFPRHGV